jgi:hypothetical protein
MELSIKCLFTLYTLIMFDVIYILFVQRAALNQVIYNKYNYLIL